MYKAIILYEGSQGLKHFIDTKLGIPEDHELFDFIKLIRNPSELTAEDYSLSWATYEGYGNSMSLHWKITVKEKCEAILEPPMNLTHLITQTLLLLLQDYQREAKQRKYGIKNG